jgi:putative photosynthetic complex assembly protein 2
MAQHGPPLLFALALWWFSTGAILWLVRRSRVGVAAGLIATGVLAVAAVAGLAVVAEDTSAVGAYVGFTCALAIWGWHELAFLTGAVTGPRRTPCPPGAAGWSRFRAASETLIHHEVALALTAVILVAVSWNAANPVGAVTFLVLFALRLSTKLNIFLGVANLPTTFLPEPLAYLQSYFRRRRMNALFPVSLALAGLLSALLARAAVAPGASAGESVGYALLFGLSALGLIEHLFLMLPSPDRALWGWALGAPRKAHAEARLALAGAREP